ncbi:MAG: hypothetical protein U0361_04710 [Nitrospiraceae bacterium]
MGRKHDLIDVMAAIGLVATLVGGYAVVMATNGFWQQTESTGDRRRRRSVSKPGSAAAGHRTGDAR